MKLYLAKLTAKSNNDVYHKVGVTSKRDALDRFKASEEICRLYDVKIIRSAFGPDKDVILWEQRLLDCKKKHFWIEDKVSGVTEMRQYTQSELSFIHRIFDLLDSDWYSMRHATN